MLLPHTHQRDRLHLCNPQPRFITFPTASIIHSVLFNRPLYKPRHSSTLSRVSFYLSSLAICTFMHCVPNIHMCTHTYTHSRARARAWKLDRVTDDMWRVEPSALWLPMHCTLWRFSRSTFFLGWVDGSGIFLSHVVLRWWSLYVEWYGFEMKLLFPIISKVRVEN